MKDGNKVWATLKTVVNQDGHAAHPITCPSVEQHIRLLEQCYSEISGDQSSVSDVHPSSVQYIEAHGMFPFLLNKERAHKKTAGNQTSSLLIKRGDRIANQEQQR